MSRQFAECAVTAQRKAAMSHQEKAGDNPLISGRFIPNLVAKVWAFSTGCLNVAFHATRSDPPASMLACGANWPRAARREPAEPRTLEMTKPAGEAGREHPAGGWGNSMDLAVTVSPISLRFGNPNLGDGEARARDRPGGLRHTEGHPSYAHSPSLAVRRSSAPAAPCRWTATPRPALPPTRAPGAPGTASRANTAARSPAPSWRSWRRCCGASTTAAPAAASRAMRRSPPRRSAPRSTVAEALKALEWAGVLTWQHRITRIRERCRDLFGPMGGAGGSSAPATPTCSATRKPAVPSGVPASSPKIRREP